MLTYGLIVPHPPAIVPAVAKASSLAKASEDKMADGHAAGRKDAQKFEQTISSLLSLSLLLKDHRPDTLVVVTPHSGIQIDSFTIRVPKTERFFSDFTEFGAPAPVESLEGGVGGTGAQSGFARDRVLTAQIIEAVNAAGLKIEPVEEPRLDFGTSVPLIYLASGLPDVQLVSLGVSFAGASEHAQLGKIIRELADESDKKIVLVASTELSHKITKSSPHGFVPRAAEWDAQVVADLKAGDYAEILNYDPFELDEVGACGYRPLATLLGAFGEVSHEQKVLSYEALTGIGVMVGCFERKSA